MREGNTMEVHSIKIVGKVGGDAMANCYSYPSQIHTLTRIKASPKMVFQVGSIVEIFSPYKYRSVELRARWQCTRRLYDFSTNY